MSNPQDQIEQDILRRDKMFLRNFITEIDNILSNAYVGLPYKEQVEAASKVLARDWDKLWEMSDYDS